MLWMAAELSLNSEMRVMVGVVASPAVACWSAILSPRYSANTLALYTSFLEPIGCILYFTSAPLWNKTAAAPRLFPFTTPPWYRAALSFGDQLSIRGVATSSTDKEEKQKQVDAHNRLARERHCDPYIFSPERVAELELKYASFPKRKGEEHVLLGDEGNSALYLEGVTKWVSDPTQLFDILQIQDGELYGPEPTTIEGIPPSWFWQSAMAFGFYTRLWTCIMDTFTKKNIRARNAFTKYYTVIGYNIPKKNILGYVFRFTCPDSMTADDGTSLEAAA
ncbi:hypothetical protein BDV98DRAFT_623815, partial [Pterulicium gracile]